MIKRDFHGFVSAKSIRASSHHSNFVLEAFDGAGGNLAFGAEPIQQQFFVGADADAHAPLHPPDERFQ